MFCPRGRTCLRCDGKMSLDSTKENKSTGMTTGGICFTKSPHQPLTCDKANLYRCALFNFALFATPFPLVRNPHVRYTLAALARLLSRGPRSRWIKRCPPVAVSTAATCDARRGCADGLRPLRPRRAAAAPQAAVPPEPHRCADVCFYVRICTSIGPGFIPTPRSNY